jgi:hypothetical protein
VESIKEYVRKDGVKLKVEEFRPARQEGSKQERIDAILEHRYSDLQVWHREGGWTPVLEEELVLARPPHDDIKDCLASAIAISCPPMKFTRQGRDKKVLAFHPRFGGVAA